VSEKKYKIKDYDFQNYVYYDGWAYANSTHGALLIGSHRICALLEVNATFTAAIYRGRIERRQGFYDARGKMISLPPITEEELMKLDMDVILSCIHQPIEIPYKVIVHTNTTEDPRWIALLERCPYARKLYTVESRMAQYQVTGWMISKEDYREVRQ